MPVHDWTLVEDGIYHGFHTVWITAIHNSLNTGLLPEGYYSLPEQHAGRFITDVLTLHASPEPFEAFPPPPPATGGILLAEAPPRVRWKRVIEPAVRTLRRSLAIRHVSRHRLVALVEIVSPANKDRADHVEEFAAKAAAALEQGVHLVLVDLFQPGPYDPHGMHGAILQRVEGSDDPQYQPPSDEPLTLAAYAAGQSIEVFLEQAAVGDPLPEMPLFLRPDRYINLPLEATYQAAYATMPAFWRGVLENRPLPDA